MKKSKQLLTMLLTLTLLSSLLITSGCGTKEEETKTPSTGSAAVSIKETKLENYEVNVKSQYVHLTTIPGKD